MRSKTKKAEDLQKGKDALSSAQTLVLLDFAKTPASDMNVLRRSLEGVGAKLQVLRKTLLGIMLKEKEIPLDVSSYDGQVGAVFAQSEITESAGTISRFMKERKDTLGDFGMISGYDIAAERSYDAAEMLRIGNLPSREILLAQFVGMVAAPLRSFLYVLQGIAEQKGSGQEQQTTDQKAPQQEEKQEEQQEEGQAATTTDSAQSSEEAQEQQSQEEESKEPEEKVEA